MYRKDDGQLHLFDITLEDTFKLNPDNRWVKRANVIPWDLAEEKYSHMFRKKGRPAKHIRMALGALLIKEFEQCSDEEVVQRIMENPYLQYFVGLKQFTNEPPFDSSLMVWFRKRLSRKIINTINEAMCVADAAPKQDEITPPDDNDDEPHGGTLILDATCTPADITYPTDTGLLAEAIEKTDGMIDTLQEPHKGVTPRPRTYRKKSRRLFTSFVKNRKPKHKLIRKVKGKQLNYLRRNLAAIEKMRERGGNLSGRQVKQLETIIKLYEQQRTMHDNNNHQVDDRIVSLSQPHIRPIVRGKAGTPVEFGAKVNVSTINGYTFVDEISYDSFFEGNLLECSIMDYYRRFGVLPAKICVDRAFNDRENRKLCKALGIKLTGKPLGRPRKGSPPGIDKQDAGRRNEIEGDFGTLKTRYGWSRIMARLPETGMTVISLSVLAMNLNKKAKAFLRFFAKRLFSGKSVGDLGNFAVLWGA